MFDAKISMFGVLIYCYWVMFSLLYNPMNGHVGFII